MAPSRAPVARKPPTATVNASAADVSSTLSTLWQAYLDDTPARLQLADAFLAFYVVTGVLLFAYCVLVTSYPFNAFLGATVGQFVLLASLRIQANPANKAVFRDIAPERAFAEFVFSSIVLHAFVFTFLCVLRRQNRSDIRSG